MSTTTRLRSGAASYLADRVGRWRTGSASGQRWVLAVLLVGVVLCFGVSLWSYGVMPVTVYLVWLIVGMMLLRFWPLAVFAAVCAVLGLTAVLVAGELTAPRISALVALLVASVLVLVHARAQRTGLPTVVSEAMLVDLRDRLQSQSVVPPLPAGWSAESANRPAYGVAYAGDFLVADTTDDGRHLEMILVDVCGKGVGAGTQALQLAGALGGLLGALPPSALMGAANDWLLRRGDDDSFATAVHVRLDLVTGAYGIVSAGHPPALRYDAGTATWLVDNARGTALGVVGRPELVESRGTLGPGEALLFYTDGVVESRDADLDVGIAWLRATAAREVTAGFGGAAGRIIAQVGRGDDDRAVLLVARD